MTRFRLLRLAPALLAIVLVLTSVNGIFSVRAQDATPEQEPAGQATPEAPPAQPWLASEFVSGAWRVKVITAKRANAFPDYGLDGRDDKDWLVAVVDVTNWSSDDETLNPRDFALEFPGGDDPRGFARRTTEGVAEQFGLEPTDTEAGVEIDEGENARLVLVFELPIDSINPKLYLDGESLSIQGAIDGGPALDDLPERSAPPDADRVEFGDAVNGFTLTTGDDETETVLSYVDGPLPDECFGPEATRRLTRLATDRLYLEELDGATFVWTEEDDSTRRLLNFEQIYGGYAAVSGDVSGPFAIWLSDAEQSSRDRGGAIWTNCTGPHGVTRVETPERSQLKISDGEGGTLAFHPWLEWNPIIVTQPDGGAWAFFGATADSGDLKDKKLIYAAHYDPTQGKWLEASRLPLGEVQLGPSAVVDSKGVVHIVYSAREKDESGYYSTLLYTREDGNGGWIEPVAISLDALAGHQIAASLTIDATDTLYVAWQDQRAFSPQALSSPANADIFVSQREVDGLWTVPVLINNHYPTSAASRPQLVVDGNRLVAVWSVYTSAMGLSAAARMEWSQRPLDDELDWTAPQTLTNGRGDLFGGRLVAMAADPTGGVVLAYGRIGSTDTFLFTKRLGPGASTWGSDTLIAFGESGTYPAIAINNLGTVYVSFNVGSGNLVDVGATAISYRSVEPGPQTIVTQDDPNTQGISAIAVDLTGQPWFIYFGEIPGQDPTIVGVIRNANVPVTPMSAS
ncbi:MAG: hypothetical protein KC438_05790 [Thermomicrobiales bacterium]|nr:hypothetical protein [Thermomicrobiales bacterium]